MRDSTSVVIADDHALVRRGTREILEQDPAISVIGEAADGREAIDLIEQLRPDVVLMDLSMPGVNGVDATREITRRFPEVEILVLTVHDDDEYVLEAIVAGASGYVLKDVSDADLRNAVHTVHDGGSVLDPQVTGVVIGKLREDETGPTALPAMTVRERDVLMELSRGSSNRVIGDALGMSPRTVEVHLRHIFEKLDVGSRTAAVMRAIKRGLLNVEEL